MPAISLVTGAAGTGKTTAEMKDPSTFLNAGWDSLIWYRDAGINNGYPYLSWQNGGGSPLPITLASFTAQINPNGPGAVLEWMTATEVNNYGFYVERRSESEEQFSTVSDLIPGAGTTTEPQYYSQIDNSLTQPGIFHYRLRQVDLDGSMHYSPVVDVDATTLSVLERAPHEFRVFQNYPNPFNPTTEIIYQMSEVGQVRLSIFDVLGEEVATLVDETKQPGRYAVTWDASGLSSGMYFYRLTTQIRSDVKKMLLVK